MKLFMSPRITVDLLFGGGAIISTAQDARPLDRAVRDKPLPKTKLPAEINRKFSSFVTSSISRIHLTASAPMSPVDREYP